MLVVSKAGRDQTIFTLLDEVVKIHVQLAFINIWGSRLKNPLRELFGDSLILAKNKI